MAAPVKLQGPKSRTYGATSATLQFDSACTNPSSIIAGANVENGTQTIAITDSANAGAYLIDVSRNLGNGGNAGEGRTTIQSKDNTSTTQVTVTVTPSGSASGTLWIEELERVTLDSTAGNTGSASDNIVTLTTTAANCRAYADFQFYPNNSSSPDTGWTSVQAVVAVSNSYHAAIVKADTGAIGGQSPTLTDTGNESNWETVIAAYKVAGVTEILGTVSVTLAALTSSSTGTVDLQAAVSKTLGNVTSVSTGTVDIVGSLTKTLADLTLGSTAMLDVFGALSKTLGDVTLVATATLTDGPSGVVNVTLGAVTLSSTGVVDIQGSLAKALDSLSLSSTGTVDLAAALVKTLANVTLTSTATAADGPIGTVSVLLADVQLNADADLDIVGFLNRTLADLTLVAAGHDPNVVTTTRSGLVLDLMRRIDKRIYKSRVVRAVLRFGTSELNGAFFQKPREVILAGGEIQGVGMSFECQYDDDIGALEVGDEVEVDHYGPVRFLRELQPGGDESGKTIIILGEL